MSELKLPFIISNVAPEYDTAIEDELMSNIRKECDLREDELIVEKLADVYRDSLPCSHPGCKSHVTHPCEGCGRQWHEKKSVHAIAHFDFDGSCHGCPLADLAWRGGICRLSTTKFSIDRVLIDDRHEHCPLCIEED